MRRKAGDAPQGGGRYKAAMPSYRLRIALALLAALAAGPARAAAILDLIRDDRWTEAATAAAAEADPVAAKLVTYYRMMAPGAATAGEISAFRTESPDWPLQATLARRRDEALAADPDDASVLAECGRGGVELPGALARCATAYGAAGRAADATAAVRRAWVALPGDAGAEAAFLSVWAAQLTTAEQWQRFDRLAWTDGAAASRQMGRLGGAERAAAAARLALRRDDPGAPALVAALTEAQRGDPALVLEQARYLRRANRDAEAVALWRGAGATAERAAPAERLAAFWDERNIMVRRRLRDGDNDGAYALAAEHAQRAGEALLDAEFLAGFVALRRLNDPARAAPHFRRLAEASRAAITQARAHFWLARAAGTDEALAKREYAAAAAFPNTFYGQLAILALGDGAAGLAARIQATRDPVWDADRALAFAGRELARAAAYLVGWGDRRRAQSFLLRLDETAPDPVDRSLSARLALGFGMPETAIGIARRAGRDGVVLLESGWPQAASIPADAGVEAPLALGVIRQESSFDPITTSGAGARGLMQLMPATAAAVARQAGMRGSVAALMADADGNIRLGTAYLRGLMDQYDACIPLAVAAYNAGPSRVAEWLGTNGDPRTGGVEMIDWIELIPFGETRNYVQRVTENIVVYRAKLGLGAPHPLAQWLR